MHVYFWGTRGSLPASITTETIETKIFKVIQMSRSYILDTDEAINNFIHTELPFAVRTSYGGNTSCVEIGRQEEYVLCDAGTGLRDFGNDYMKTKMTGRENLSNVFHLFISHLHWDHIQGFPFFVPAFVSGHHVHIYGYQADLEKTFIHQHMLLPSPFP